MIDLETLLKTIDQLPPDELETIRARIEERSQTLYRERMSTEDPEIWIAELHATVAAFREGLSADRLNEIIADMNIGYISPKELAILEQLGGREEDDI